MAAYWIGWVLAGVLVGEELLSGTFYLLALGVAFALGGIAAFLGAGIALQLFVAGALAIAGTVAPHLRRRTRGSGSADLAIDIGQAVRVQAWNADGTARRLPRLVMGGRARLFRDHTCRDDVHRGNARVDADHR